MSAFPHTNGDGHAIASFEDVEDALRDAKTRHAEFAIEVSGCFGKIARDLSTLTRGQDEIRRLLIEGHPDGPMRDAMDTGSFVVATINRAKAAAADPASPLRPSDVQAIVARHVRELELVASATRWDRFVALFPYLGRESLKVLVTLAVGVAAVYAWHLITAIHR